MKRISALLVAVLALIAGTVSSAVADDYYYWPDFGSFASHNDWGAKAVRAPQANSLGATGAGVKVAYLDDGISATAPGLRSKVIAYKDFLPGNYVRPEHGTMVASTIASDYDPAVGIRGIAPGVSLIVARVCHHGGCDNTAIRKGLAWAIEQGAQVVSISFTGFTDAAMLGAFKAAEKKGVVVVASMGNSGCGPYSNWGINPYCLQGKTRESTQASYPIPGLIAVGASDQRGGRVATLGWSSSYGPNMDLIAPGTDTSAYDSFSASNGFGGTSSSAPIVAGVAALVLQMNPNLKLDQVQAILQATASPALEEKAKVWDSCEYNADTKLWNCNQVVDSEFPQQYFTGAGVVNAEAAVALAKRSFQGLLLEPVTLSQSNLVLDIQWQGGPADLYINSKLVAKNASSGYQYQGFLNQSVAVHIQRYQKQSLPALAMMVDYLVPEKPVISRSFVDSDLQLRFEVIGLESQLDKVWRKKNPWDPYAEYSGVFEFDDGEIVGCYGNNHLAEETNFYCSFQRDRTAVSGRFRVMGKNAQLSEPSELISVQIPVLPSKIIFTTTYQDSGLPKFEWPAVPGAKSYQYRYQPQALLYCTQQTSFTVEEQPTQPSSFYVVAFSDEDCSGTTLGSSDYIGWVAQPIKPQKPMGITVKSIWYQNVEFDIPNRDPNALIRIYRSDGLMLRIFPGQRVQVGMQNNEDVNGKAFSYRFVQITNDPYGETWSDASDPIVVTFPDLAAPKAECNDALAGKTVSCKVSGGGQRERTRLEYLDSDMTVISYVELLNPTLDFRYRQKNILGAAYVRIASTMGNENSRNSWYRRGESQTIKISPRKQADLLAQVF